MTAAQGAPVGRADGAARQIERVARHISAQRGGAPVMVIAHSWGTVPAMRFAGTHPERVAKLVLFGPIAERDGAPHPPTTVPALQSSEADQWKSFQAGVPQGEAPPFAPDLFRAWIQAYLATDRDAAQRVPPSVRVPSGPEADLNDAWSGHLPVEPSLVRAPTLLVRGSWDAVTEDRDMTWLTAALRNVPGGARAMVLPRGTHRMHLETNRQDVVRCGRRVSTWRSGMMAVIFEVWPAAGRKQDYIDIAGALRPLLDGIDGFLSIERFGSLTEDGKILSLSFWRDEDAVRAWRENGEHRLAQQAGRGGIFADYRLRVAKVVRDYGMFERAQVPKA